MNLSLLLTAVVCPIAMAAMMVLMMRGSRREHDSRVSGASVGAQPEGRVLYVRNLKEGPIRIPAGGVPHRIGGRGLPGDVIALPATTLQEPDLAGYLDLHWIEAIDDATYRARCNATQDEAAHGNGVGPTPTPRLTANRRSRQGER